jgi:DUF3046 family protein
MPATADPFYVGFPAGRRTTGLPGRAMTRLLPSYLITTHPLSGFWGTSSWSWPVRTEPVRARQYPGDVRLTEFWDRMRTQFGDAYAQSVAKDFVFDKLGGRTVDRALADGVDAKLVWRAVCDTFKVPENLR